MTIVEERTKSSSRVRVSPRRNPGLMVWGPEVADAFAVRSQEASRRTLSPASEFFRARARAFHGAVSTAAIDRATQILKLTTDASTRLPNVHEDEGGVSLYWRDGSVSVQIDVTGGADFYVRIRNRSTGGDFEAYDGKFPVAEVQSALNQLGAGD